MKRKKDEDEDDSGKKQREDEEKLHFSKEKWSLGFLRKWSRETIIH